MTTIMRELHNKLFDFLIHWNSSTLDDNKYFYLRTKKDERFKRGFWFLGDENYIAISFWTGIDHLHRTPNIYFSINPQKGVSSFVIGRDSVPKFNFMQNEIIPNLEGYHKIRSRKIWEKKYGPYNDETVLDHLSQFIQNDKLRVDLIFESKLSQIEQEDDVLFDDEFASKVGFISEEQFHKLVNRVEQQRHILEVEGTLSRENKRADSLPISLYSIYIENFNGITKLNIEQLPNNPRWIYFTGPNGSGKTNMLKAIGLGLTSFKDNVLYLHPKTMIKVGYFDQQKLYLTTVKESYRDGESIDDHFVGYGTFRLNRQSESTENLDNKNSSGLYRLFNNDGLVKNISYQMKQSWYKNDRTEFENLKKAIQAVLGYRISDITVEESEVYFHEADTDKNYLGKTLLDQIASGFQGIVNLVGDIVIRFSKPGLKYEEFYGIVVIDEVENHLHPRLQRDLPGLLSAVFPKLQFIVSTHSPIPILGAPKDSLIFVLDRDVENGFSVQRMDDKVNISNLLPNTILTSPIFDLEMISAVSHSEDQLIRTEKTYKEVLLNDDVRAKLKIIAKGLKIDEKN